MKVRDLIKLVEMDGWHLVKIVGSHRQYKHTENTGKCSQTSKIREMATRVIERDTIMSRFLIIIEKGDANYSAYVPDLPGCIATGKTLEETKTNMRQAIRMHLEGMLEDQEPLPVPQTTAEYLDIPVPPSAA